MRNIKKMKKKMKKKEKFRLVQKIGAITRKKRMRNMIFVVLIIMCGLAFRIGWIQFKMGNKLQHMAHLQQTLEREFNPKRGTIYDATGEKILAVSASVESITVNPVNISSENKEKVARKLSELFELDYEKVLKKVSKRSFYRNNCKKSR